MDHGFEKQLSDGWISVLGDAVFEQVCWKSLLLAFCLLCLHIGLEHIILQTLRHLISQERAQNHSPSHLSERIIALS